MIQNHEDRKKDTDLFFDPVHAEGQEYVGWPYDGSLGETMDEAKDKTTFSRLAI